MFLKRIFNRKSDVPVLKEKSILEMSDAEYDAYWKDKCDKETDIIVNRLLSTGKYISLGKYVNKENHNFYILTSTENLFDKTLYAVNSETMLNFYSRKLRQFELPFISYKVDTNAGGSTILYIYEFHTDITDATGHSVGFKNMGYGLPLIEKLIDLATQEYHANKITGKLSDIDCTNSEGNFQKDLMEYRNDFYAKRGFTVKSDESGNGSIVMLFHK